MKRSRRIDREDRRAMLVLASVLAAFVLYIAFRPTSGIAENNRETLRQSVVSEVDSLLVPKSLESEEDAISSDMAPIRTDRYPGPPKKVSYPSKLKPGAIVDLNSADTLLLQRVPGIGATFARRIFMYRELLGGYYVVEQLQEVYGMDRERYDQISSYFVIKTDVRPLVITEDSIPHHPYLQFRHRDALRRLTSKHATVTWDMLMQSGVFNRDDSLRLAPYLSLPKIEDVRSMTPNDSISN